MDARVSCILRAWCLGAPCGLPCSAWVPKLTRLACQAAGNLPEAFAVLGFAFYITPVVGPCPSFTPPWCPELLPDCMLDRPVCR